MMNWRAHVTALIAALLLASSSQAAEISINGSTTILPIAQVTAESYMKSHPGTRITVSGGGSGNGAKALADGMAQIAAMSREIKPSEVESAKKKGVTPVRHIVAYDCIVPVVHPSNPVKNLTIAQLRAIYAGEITNWRDVGGPNKRIAVVGRDTSSGTYEVWEERIMQKARVTPRALIVASSGALVQTVAKNPLAIGYDSLGYVDGAAVKPLSIEGIAGTVKTARSGEIVTSRQLYMYTNGKPQGLVKSYLDFLQGEEGQRLVAQQGFTTIK